MIYQESGPPNGNPGGAQGNDHGEAVKGDNSKRESARQAQFRRDAINEYCRQCAGDASIAFSKGCVEFARKLDTQELEHFRVRLKELGVRVGKWDDAIKAAGGEDDPETEGEQVIFPDVVPCKDPVDPAGMLSDIASFILKHVDMSNAYADACALWIAHTWLHDHPGLETSTFLSLTSATKRCGKSLTAETLAALAYRALPLSGSFSEPWLFRTIDAYAPTLFADEVDTYLAEKPELRGALNGSQRRVAAFAGRVETVGEKHIPVRYTTWAPKCFVGIGDLPDTTRDRSLVLPLERRAPDGRPLVPWRGRDRAEIASLLAKLARWREDCVEAALRARPPVNEHTAYPEALHDRACDAWEVLFGIAIAAGADWPKRAWDASVAIAAMNGDDDGVAEMLLSDMKVVFDYAKDRFPDKIVLGDDGNVDAVEVSAMVSALKNMSGRPWAGWARGQGITEQGISGKKLLGAFKPPVKSRQKMINGRRARRYWRRDLEALWARYSGPGGGGAVQPCNRKASPSVEGDPEPCSAETDCTATDAPQPGGNPYDCTAARLEDPPGPEGDTFAPAQGDDTGGRREVGGRGACNEKDANTRAEIIAKHGSHNERVKKAIRMTRNLVDGENMLPARARDRAARYFGVGPHDLPARM